MTQTQEPAAALSLADAPSLIEHAFPVAKLSAESYKERDAKSGQRLPAIGKWWGRKPLVLVRATILGALMPATGDPQKDNEVFERLMGMDDFGLYERRSRKKATVEEFTTLTNAQQLKAAKLAEIYNGPSDSESWSMINAHLGTNASSLQEIVGQLGIMRFGHKPRVGDVFSGGGSIPFEAARIGCDTYASDLNPVAALLTWSNQALLCATPEDKVRIDAAQTWVYEEADRQIKTWGVEHDDQGRRADAYLWCHEVLDPETGYRIPLAATWVISERHRVVAELKPDKQKMRFEIDIISDASDEQMRKAKAGTVVRNHLTPPPVPGHPAPHATNMSHLRDRQNNRTGLRRWSKTELMPTQDDFFQERLYCIRWSDAEGERSYESVTQDDLEREALVARILKEHLEEWKTQGYIPDQEIATMDARNGNFYTTRGWTHWQHVFTPRQLLTNGLFGYLISKSEAPQELSALISKIADSNSKCCRWKSGTSQHITTFDAQSISPLYNFGSRAFLSLESCQISTSSLPKAPFQMQLRDARTTATAQDIWITDPPYADAIRYDELSEFFLAWHEKRIPLLFPHWYTDSKRALALKGKGVNFNEAMIEVYSTLTQLMPSNGMQIVMFTHQDAAVWSDLAMTMWVSGLKVSAAWTVATEVTDGLKGGTNSVQATVLLVLRKRGEVETVFDDDILNLMEDEVAKQLKDMQLLEGAGLRWSDADLHMATYAAALRVITSHNIHGLDPHKELLKVRARGEKSPVHLLIDQAAQAATRNMIPRGLDAAVWRDLDSHERFYLKGLDTEQKGEHRSGVFQELARSYAASAWRDLLADNRANNVRLMTATEMGGRNVNTGPLAGTLLRHLLLAIQITAREDGPAQGLAGLRDDVPNFAMQHSRAITLLEHLGKLTLPHWKADAEAAQVLRGALMNAGV